MEAGGEAVAVVAADVGEPEGAGLEGGGVAALGHEVDAVGGELELGLEGADFVEVGLVADDKFEGGVGQGCEEAEGVEVKPELSVYAGVGELRGDVELGDSFAECVRGDLGSVGLDLDEGDVGEEVVEGDEVFLLKEGLAAGEDEAVAIVVGDEGRDFGGGELGDLLGLGEFHSVLVFPGGLFPVPSVGGIAPNAVEVAEGEAEEDCGGAQ